MSIKIGKKKTLPYTLHTTLTTSISIFFQDVILSFRAMGLCKFYSWAVESILLKSILIANNAWGCCVLILWVLRKPIVILQQCVSTGSSDNKKIPQKTLSLFACFFHIYPNYLLLLTLLPVSLSLPQLVNFQLRFPQVYWSCFTLRSNGMASD